MPKISSTGEPSYAGHEGVVTNAVGEQFEVDPTRELDGERTDGYTNEPIGELEQSSPPGVGGDVAPVEDDGDSEDDRAERDEQGRDNDQRPRLVDHRQSEARQSGEEKSRTAAKKSAPAATQK